MIFRVVFVFSAIILLFLACKKLDYDVSINSNVSIEDVIRFDTHFINYMVADSSSHVVFKIFINELASKEFDTIKLSTNLGFFENGEKEISKVVNAEKYVNVPFFSGTEDGVAIIRAGVAGYSIDKKIELVKSMPSDLFFTPGIFISDSTTVNVDLSLFRDEGKVGKDIKVWIDYTAVDTFGLLLDIPSFVLVKDRVETLQILNPLGHVGSFIISGLTLNQEKDTIYAEYLLIFDIE